MELLCALVGKAPFFGLMTDEGRKAKWLPYFGQPCGHWADLLEFSTHAARTDEVAAGEDRPHHTDRGVRSSQNLGFALIRQAV